MPGTFVRYERKRKPERGFRVYRNPPWIDPFWFLTGSSIEKKVMAELARRGIYFIYRSQSNTLGGAVDPSWEADFLLPHHKIWIEIQGAYWHSKNNQILADAFRYAAIEQMGWRPLFWWEWDIHNRLPELMDAVPEFYMARLDLQAAARSRYGTSTVGDSRLPFRVGALNDQLVGLRSALAKRRQQDQLRFVRRRPWQRREK